MGTGFEAAGDYDEFAADVRSRLRYFRTPKAEAFLAGLRDTSARWTAHITKGAPLWRAALGCDRPNDANPPTPYSAERMKPLPDKAFEGRVNPKGIPCLYLASEPITAVSEIRAGIGEYVSLAEFRTERSLKLVDCSSADGAGSVFWTDQPTEKEYSAWQSVNYAFSTPVDRSDDRAAYAPTQVIAEMFRVAGFDGVAYRTSFGTGGHNFALFNASDASVARRYVYRVDDVSQKVSVVSGSATD